jgi:hypothetical protein
MRLHKLKDQARTAGSWIGIIGLFFTIIAAISSSYALGNKAALDAASSIQQAIEGEKNARLDHETRFMTRDEFSKQFYREMQKLHSEIDDLRVLIEKRQR